MDLIAGPVVLGSIMAFMAFGAWALGRWQGGRLALEGVATPAPSGLREGAPLLDRVTEALPAPSAPTAGPVYSQSRCQDAARDERRVALAAAPSLGELHAEITAYRHAQQVFANLDAELLRLVPLTLERRHECRFLGLTGEPTCGIGGPARTTCASGTPCAEAVPMRGPAREPQLSALPADVTRV